MTMTETEIRAKFIEAHGVELFYEDDSFELPDGREYTWDEFDAALSDSSLGSWGYDAEKHLEAIRFPPGKWYVVLDRGAWTASVVFVADRATDTWQQIARCHSQHSTVLSDAPFASEKEAEDERIRILRRK